MKEDGRRCGVGIDGVIQIVLIILKLCGVINWSWFWVLTPLWIGVCVVAIILIIFIMKLIKLKRRYGRK